MSGHVSPRVSLLINGATTSTPTRSQVCQVTCTCVRERTLRASLLHMRAGQTAGQTDLHMRAGQIAGQTDLFQSLLEVLVLVVDGDVSSLVFADPDLLFVCGIPTQRTDSLPSPRSAISGSGV